MNNKNKNKMIAIIGIIVIVITTVIAVFALLKDYETITITSDKENISLVADFYNNHGDIWLSVKGTTFSITPNKIKEYYYDTNGDWTFRYAMSSIMSISIDDYNIENCGSTVIFADDRLQKFDIDIPKEVFSSENDSSIIQTPTDLSTSDYLTLDWWWKTKELNNKTKGSRIVVIQSQDGDNICMYCGDEVTWDIPSNLPKTTQITIDGMPLFIHRANFAIIDIDLFNKAGK